MKRAVCLIVVLMAAMPGLAKAEPPVYFADANLKAVVEAELGISDPTPTDMLALTTLDADHRGITDLTGLEHATNLTELNLYGNQISDISVLAGLTKLTWLDLCYNPISDISALAGLANLTQLRLHYNLISDISALAGLTNLRVLYLSSNQISNISAVSGLTNLTILGLHYNQIRYISAVSGLTNLTILRLHYNQIRDISVLSGLTNLMWLDLYYNQISDISAVAGLAKLTWLELEDNRISDISALAGLTMLTRLGLTDNPLHQDACDIYIPQILANNPGIGLWYDPCLEPPTVTTGSATDVQNTTATLWGQIGDDGGEACQYRFRYEKSGGSYSYTSWTGSKTTGQSFSQDISGLSPGSVYYFNARAKNSAGSSSYGDRESFTTLPIQDTLTIYVDDNALNDPEPNNPAISDPNENGSAEHPFDMIQEGIDAALDGETVIVRYGTYREAIEFAGRNITVTGFDPNEPNAILPYPVIDANYIGTAVTFRNEEEPNCILEGFVITRGAGEVAGGINCMGSSPTISHCLIVGNRVMDPNGGGGAVFCIDSNAVFENCTFSGNYGGEQGAGLYLCDSNAVLLNCIVWDNLPYQIAVTCGLDPNITFSDVADGWPPSTGSGQAGEGNIDIAPGFAELGYWADANDPNIAVEPSEANAVWVGGDYHLKSQAGRWEPYSASWLIDDVTSLCIDAGDPNSDWTAELWPHGERINMGAYGGTPQASMSLSTVRNGGEWTYDGGIFVGVYYYPWYGPTAHRVSQSLRGHLVPEQTAELGEYDNASQEVITRHIDYSHRANIHFWACSWWGPGTYVDNVLRYHILPHRYAGELRYAILYESTGRLGSFSNPDYSNLVPDFQYFADNYFSDPNYLKIDGRPVVFIYLTRVYFRGKLGYDALAALRAAFPNIYIIADDIFGRNYSSANASKWDAVTAYDVYGQTLQSYGSTGAALNQLESILSEAKTAANSVGVGLIPFAAPGFNDKGVRDGHDGAPRYFEDDPSSSEGDLFRSMLRNVVVPKVDPLAENILMVTSFNEWHEDTQIEPTMGTGGTTNIDDSATGSDYTQGDYYTDYGYLYLDILSQETSFLQVDFLSEALDRPLSFTTGGDADWFAQTATAYYDGDAAQSGDISDEQESWMQTTVSGAGTVSFYWKVSSEGYCDFLEFYIDGSLQDRISGLVDWQQMTYTITASGPHTLKWRYTKDQYASKGDDCGWVDKVEWGS